VLAEDVVRRFGDRVVLDHLWLTIAASEFVVLLGPPRCGKTTLLRLLAGVDSPDAGTVSGPATRAIVFQGTRPRQWPQVWRNVTTGLSGRDGPDPALVLLDEPSALDAITRQPMHDYVRALRRRPRTAMQLVTRDVDEAIALADRIVILRDGRIGREHRVKLSSQDRCRGAAREQLRANLLAEAGMSCGG
jgi:sulfonate transport system ATP-binding protein